MLVHVLNVFSGAQRILGITFINVVDLSSVLIAIGVGNKSGTLRRNMRQWYDRLWLTHDRHSGKNMSTPFLHQRLGSGPTVDIALRVRNILWS